MLLQADRLNPRPWNVYMGVGFLGAQGLWVLSLRFGALSLGVWDPI